MSYNIYFNTLVKNKLCYDRYYQILSPKYVEEVLSAIKTRRAVHAEKTGDIRRYYALSAKADKMVDQFIYS